MIRVVHPGSRILIPIFTHPGSRIQVSKRHRIPDPDPQQCKKPFRAPVLPKAAYAGQAASQWLELRLQLIGCGVVGGVALTAVIQHHVSGADPGMVGLAIR
jgi:hypothetical protein